MIFSLTKFRALLTVGSALFLAAACSALPAQKILRTGDNRADNQKEKWLAVPASTGNNARFPAAEDTAVEQQNTRPDQIEPELNINRASGALIDCSKSLTPQKCQWFDDLSAMLRFEPGSAELTSTSQQHLETAVEPLQDNTVGVSVLTYIEGPGDSILATLLAKRRTLFVIHYLANRGIPVARLRPREPRMLREGVAARPAADAGRLVEMRVLPR